jgi:uncharacterized membrane protein YeaQ/YmgE (transglycosylase-associated protein family)
MLLPLAQTVVDSHPEGSDAFQIVLYILGVVGAIVVLYIIYLLLLMIPEVLRYLKLSSK